MRSLEAEANVATRSRNPAGIAVQAGKADGDGMCREREGCRERRRSHVDTRRPREQEVTNVCKTRDCERLHEAHCGSPRKLGPPRIALWSVVTQLTRARIGVGSGERLQQTAQRIAP